ncbi:MAG: hypothetical protein GX196_04620 [Clostridiaceae bacterium]|nr:hypothetical protein [Clostridiaceae bacterium]
MSFFEGFLNFINSCGSLPQKADLNGFNKSNAAVFIDGGKAEFFEDISEGGLFSLPFRILIRIKPKDNSEKLKIYETFNNIMLYFLENQFDYNGICCRITPSGCAALNERYNDGTEEYSQSFNLFYYK